MRALSLSIPLLLVACQEPAKPEPAAPVSSVTPVTSAPPVAASSSAPPAPPSVTALPSAAPSAVAVEPPPATGPVASREDAVARAVPAANAALDRAYAKTKPPIEPHKGPWVRAESAGVQGDAKRGFRVMWDNHPTAGFDYVAEVTVSAKGDVKVVKATASFSPD